LAEVLHEASSKPSGIYQCTKTIWRYLKESLRPQFSFEKADMMEGLLEVQVQSKSDNIIHRRDFSINRKEDVLCQLKKGPPKNSKTSPALIKAKICQFFQHF
jgi:hypothetical protein